MIDLPTGTFNNFWKIIGPPPPPKGVVRSQRKMLLLDPGRVQEGGTSLLRASSCEQKKRCRKGCKYFQRFTDIYSCLGAELTDCENSWKYAGILWYSSPGGIVDSAMTGGAASPPFWRNTHFYGLNLGKQVPILGKDFGKFRKNTHCIGKFSKFLKKYPVLQIFK